MERMLGAYQVLPKVGEGEMEVFRSAMEGHAGVDLEPVAVAVQTVAGTNYIFVCNGHPVVQDPETKLYAVKISRPLDGTVKCESVDEIDVPGLVSK